MVQLTTEHGTFEGQTVKEAQAQARKAAREAREKARQQELDRTEARKDAALKAYQVMARKLEGKRQTGYYCLAGKPCGPKQPTPERHLAYASVHETLNGVVTVEHYSAVAIASATDGGGLTRVIFLRDTHTGETIAYALGTHNGSYCLLSLPGISPADWSPEPETPAPF